jgi:hypothetical protein
MVDFVGQVKKRAVPAFGWVVLALGFAMVLVAALAPEGARAAIGFLQQATGGGSGVSNYTITLTSKPATGDALVLSHSADLQGATDISSVTGGGVTWVFASKATAGQNRDHEIWYGCNASGSGTTTITVTLLGNLGGGNGASGNVSEWSGIAASSCLDQTASNNGSSTSPTTGITPATSQANELLIGGMHSDDDAASAPSNGFSALNFVTTASGGTYSGYRVVSSIGTYSTGWTTIDVKWAASIATFRAAGGTGGLQVSSRSDTLSDSRPSATSNHTVVFTTNKAIYGSSVSNSSTVVLTFDASFSFPSNLDCGDVDAATSVQFSFNYPACQATATAWGFSATGSVITLVPPSGTGVYVPTSTQVTIKIGSNATVGQTGDSWITNPSTAGTYTISVGGTFGGSGNMLVSILSGVTVEARVAEHLSVSVVGVPAISLVQAWSGNDTQSFAYSSNVKAGNFLVCVVSADSNDDPISVSDNVNGSWTAGPDPGWNNNFHHHVTLWYFLNAAAGKPTVTVTGPTAGGATHCAEYSGVATSSAVDGSATVNDSTSTTVNVGTINTTVNGDLVIAFASTDGGSFTLTASTTQGYAMQFSDTVQYEFGEDQIQSANGSISGYFSGSNGTNHWSGGIAAFKPAPASSACAADDGATISAVGTTNTLVPFGTVSANTFYQGCQDIEISTNAGGGYVATVREESALRTGSGSTIPDTSCDTGCDEITGGTWVNPANVGFGHTCRNQTGSDCNLEYGDGTKFRRFPSVVGGTAGLGVKVATGSFTGNGTARTISHGLGVQPKVIMLWLDEDAEQAGFVLRTDQHTTASSIQFPTGSGKSRVAPDMVTDSNSTTFSLGTASSVNQTSSSYQWVAYAGTGVATGSYNGNGVDDRNIPHGMSASPKMLFVWLENNGSMGGLCGRTDQYAGDVSICWSTGASNTVRAADQIQAMDGANFQVGTDAKVNGSGSPYKWFALAGPSTQTGSYTGNSQDNRDIAHGLSATPSKVFVWTDTDNVVNCPVVRSNQHVGDVSIHFACGAIQSSYGANKIQAMSATSFEVGTGGDINFSGEPHQWFAVKSSSQFSEVAGETLMASSTPVRIAVGRVKYRLAIPSNQPAGAYTTKVTYIITPTY